MKKTIKIVISAILGTLMIVLGAGCSDNGFLDQATCDHDYNLGKITRAATCDRAGIRTYTCQKCDYEKTELIAKLDHTPSALEEVSATCTIAGYALYECEVCGNRWKEATAKLPHNYQTVAGVEPTCTTAGTTGGEICLDCGHEKTATKIPALGHTIEYLGEPCSTCEELIYLENGYTAAQIATGESVIGTWQRIYIHVVDTDQDGNEYDAPLTHEVWYTDGEDVFGFFVQAGAVYPVAATQTEMTAAFESRTTAGGAEIIDGKTTLKTVEGSTVTTKNLLNPNKLTGGGGLVEFNGVQCYHYKDGNAIFSYEYPFKTNTQYTLSIRVFRNEGVTSGLGIIFNYSDETTSTAWLVPGELSSITSTAGKTLVSICGTEGYNAAAYIDLTVTQIEEGDTVTDFQMYYDGFKSAAFSGVTSMNADGSETSTFEFPLIEMPLGRIIDFENQKILDYGVEVVLTGEEMIAAHSDVVARFDALRITAAFVCTDAGTTGNFVDYGIKVLNNVPYWSSYKNIDSSVTDIDTFKAYLAQRYADGNPVRIRYISETLQGEMPFTDEQKAAVAQYKAWKGGTETVQGNENAAYGAMNTITQTYCTLNDYYSDAIENSEFLSINGSDTLGYYVDVYFQEGLSVTLPISSDANKKFTLSADTAAIVPSSYVYTLSGKSCGKAHKAVGLKGCTATCTESGLTDGSVCLRCGAVLQTQEEIPALGHDGVAGETCGTCGETIAHTAYRLVEPTIGESAIGNWYRIYLGESTFASVTFFDGTNNFYYDVYSEYHWVEAIQGESGDGNPFPYIEGTDEKGAYVEIYVQEGLTFTATLYEGESNTYEITDNVTFEGCTGGEIYRLDFEETSDE